MKKFLIVHDNRDMRDMLADALDESFTEDGESPLISVVRSQRDALTHCSGGGPFDCIVLSLVLAANRQQSPASRQGLELLRVLRQRQIETPALLIAPARPRDEGIERDAYRLGATPLFQDEITGVLHQEVVRRVRQAVGRERPTVNNRLEVEIDLALSAFQIKDRLERLVPPPRGRLQLDQQSLSAPMTQLIDTVKKKGSSWESRLRDVGKMLHYELFVREPNLELRDALVGAREATGCHGEAVQLHFVVGREEYVVPLEAILSFDGNEYWMLQAPLYRAVYLKSGLPRSKPLFVDGKEPRHPLNCLLINADTHGEVDHPPCELKQMKNTKKECEALRMTLERYRGKLNLGKIKLLSPDESSDEDTPCADTLQQRLSEQNWHLIHYAGHSCYDGKQAYLFLPAGSSPAPQPVEAREFASWFRRDAPRFVYLSSCESAASDFVFELAGARLPAVAGFRWEIPEDAAAHYAKSFYKHLLRERSLEVAFWKARREIHDEGDPEQNLIWAAAMLVIQDYG